MSKSGKSASFCHIFAKTFFVNFFLTLFKRILLGHIRNMFSNFEAQRAKTGSKTGKPFFYKHVLEFNYATISTG
jgi:hypothetical protein